MLSAALIIRHTNYPSTLSVTYSCFPVASSFKDSTSFFTMSSYVERRCPKDLFPFELSAINMYIVSFDYAKRDQPTPLSHTELYLICLVFRRVPQILCFFLISIWQFPRILLVEMFFLEFFFPKLETISFFNSIFLFHMLL